MSFSRGAVPVLRRLLLENSLKQSIAVVPRRFAGHSHWQNTRHLKAATDAHKQIVSVRFARLIEAAVTCGGGPDPKFNSQLATVIEQAKKTQVVTNAMIEAAIKRAADPTARKNTTSTLLEFFGDKGVLAVATAETLSASKLKHDMKMICRKHVWAIAKGGVKERFEEKNYVTVGSRQDGSTIDSDELLAAGIEGGAEDMNEMGEADRKVYEFTCAPGTQYILTKALQQENYVISDIGTKWIPLVPIEVEEDYAKKVGEFCDSMEEHPEITSIFTNLA